MIHLVESESKHLPQRFSFFLFPPISSLSNLQNSLFIEFIISLSTLPQLTEVLHTSTHPHKHFSYIIWVNLDTPITSPAFSPPLFFYSHLGTSFYVSYISMSSLIWPLPLFMSQTNLINLSRCRLLPNLNLLECMYRYYTFYGGILTNCVHQYGGKEACINHNVYIFPSMCTHILLYWLIS